VLKTIEYHVRTWYSMVHHVEITTGYRIPGIIA